MTTDCPNCAATAAAAAKVIRERDSLQTKLDDIRSIVTDWRDSPVPHAANMALVTIREILEEA